MAELLLVDDDADILKLLALRLATAGHRVRTADSGEQALVMFQAQRPQLVITDLKMGGMDGLALFDEIQRRAPTLPVIVLTAHGTIPEAVDATRRGVFGFLTKPFDGKALLEQVEQALRLASPAGQGGGENEPWRADLVGGSPAIQELLERARLVAASDASVFIAGASGTGKELLARAIHLASPRAEKPFVAINCAAIPENLLESELFGHRKGAFTGATYNHKGLFLEADGGTVFLDEIGDMPLSLQAKLLRVLQERQVRPVGATQAVPVDVRVVSATHRDLDELLKSGQFREDLYYRLNVVSLALPLLAERREDIPLLANHFLQRTASRYGKPVTAFAPDAMEALVTAPWPGNVRQLQNVVEQAVALSPVSGGLVPAALIQGALRSGDSAFTSLDEAKKVFERDYLVRLLRLTEGSVTQAARLAQRNRTEFYKLLERHQLDAKQFKPGAGDSA